MSLIATIIIFSALNYSIQNMINWYGHATLDMQVHQEILPNEVKNTVTKKMSEEIKEPAQSPKSDEIIIPEKIEEVQDSSVWQIEIPKFRAFCTN